MTFLRKYYKLIDNTEDSLLIVKDQLVTGM